MSANESCFGLVDRGELWSEKQLGAQNSGVHVRVSEFGTNSSRSAVRWEAQTLLPGRQLMPFRFGHLLVLITNAQKQRKGLVMCGCGYSSLIPDSRS